MAHPFSTASDQILGKGSYGVVYKGIFQGSQVAVKRINLDNVSQSKREVEALQKLEHENVIRLFGYEDSDHCR
jgi:serine/threonine protein kinase